MEVNTAPRLAKHVFPVLSYHTPPHKHFWSHFCSNLSFWAGCTVESAGYGMLRTLLEKWVIESARQGGITWSSYSQLGPTHALETWITPPVGVRFVCTPLVSFRRFSYQDGFEEIIILSPSLSCKSASLSILITTYWGYTNWSSRCCFICYWGYVRKL